MIVFQGFGGEMVGMHPDVRWLHFVHFVHFVHFTILHLVDTSIDDGIDVLGCVAWTFWLVIM